MRFFVLLFFFLSGACGLIYEVVWTKLFELTMGGGVYAISTVVATFMGGLALGSRYGGKWIDRRGNPLLTYGVIEGAIGVYCLIIPYLTKLVPFALRPFYDRFYADNPFVFGFIRFLLCAAILLIPTTLMGASLPVLARYYASDKSRFGRDVGRLYAINAIGAAIGAFSAGFFLLPMLGKKVSIYSAACVNVGICLIVLFYWFIKERGKRVEIAPAKEPESPLETAQQSPKWGAGVLWGALAVYAANGFSGMAYQVSWTRALTLSLGSSAYSFTMIVTVFILGLAIGAGVGSKLADRLKDPARAMAWAEILVGFSAMWAMWGLGRAPKWMTFVIGRFSDNWSVLIAVEFLLVAILLFLPTFLMGVVFPLAMKTVGLCRSGVGEPVGLAYGINTAGAILGSLSAGFVLIPLIGIQRTIAAANILNWASGGVLLWLIGASQIPLSRWAKSVAPLVVGVIAALTLPRWDAALMSSGPFVYSSGVFENSSIGEKKDVLFYEEGVDATVAVLKSDDENVMLRVNGKTDASTGLDMLTQELSAHIPMLASKNPKKVCVIGLASGVTLGSVTRYPVESVDIIELSSAVVDASRYFDKWNYGALKDPRVNLIVGDGRNHLLTTSKKYDVIISEPSNPWIAGESALFTKEFFESARDRLEPGGVFCSWVHGYQMPTDSFRMVMRTFQAVFPQATLWNTINASDYMMVGSLDGIVVNPDVIDSRMRTKGVGEDLARINVSDAAELLGRFILGPRRFMMAGGEGAYHSDDYMQVEYNAPKFLYYSGSMYENFYTEISKFAEHPSVIIGVDRSKWKAEFSEKLDREVVGRDAIANAVYFFSTGKINEAFAYLKEAIWLSPRNKAYKSILENITENVGSTLIGENKYGEALTAYRIAVGIDPASAVLRAKLASVYMLMKNTDEARREYEKAIELDPDNLIALYSLGFIYLTQNEIEKARTFLKKAVEINPDFPQAQNVLGSIYAREQRFQEAEAYFRKAVELDPNYADACVNLGKLLIQHNDEKKRKEGKAYIKRALDLDPTLSQNPEFAELLKKAQK